MSRHLIKQIFLTTILLILSFLWGIYIFPQLSGVSLAKLVVAFIQPVIALAFLLCYLVVLRFSHDRHHSRHIHISVLANLLIIFSLFMSMLTQWFVMGGTLHLGQFLVPTTGLFLMLVGYLEHRPQKFNYWYVIGFTMLFGIFNPSVSFAVSTILFVISIFYRRALEFFSK